MAYDLYGTEPTADEGTHFRMSVFAWPEFVRVLLKFAPEECKPCKEWYGEDCYGRGLDAGQALRLAEKLRSHIFDATILDYISEVVQEQERECDAAWISQGDLHDFVAFLKACGGFEIK
jgi:hypothetical protein